MFPFKIIKKLAVNILWIQYFGLPFPADFVFSIDSKVISIGGDPVGNFPFLGQRFLKGLDHVLLLGHTSDPVIWFDAHRLVSRLQEKQKFI